MIDEPSVLDYFKSLLTFWRNPPIKIPGEDIEVGSESYDSYDVQMELHYEEDRGIDDEIVDIKPHTQLEDGEIRDSQQFPWRAILSLILALAAQFSLEPGPERTWITGSILYIIAAVFLVWAYIRGEFKPTPIPKADHAVEPMSVRTIPLLLGILISLVAFILFSGNRFTWLNTLLWLTGLILVVSALWLPASKEGSWYATALRYLNTQNWNLKISPWTILIIVVGVLALFFRLYRLDQVPPEMISDHAEKLLDVWDVLHGQTSIFFPRNTGREAFQMYLTAGVISLVGTGYTFLSLKIGTVLVGILTLPFIYLLGVEIANRRVGLLALAFAGIAYWPNTISRIALRFTLFPFFFAPALYFFLRGLRTSNRNYFILAGLFVGLGLHGYSPYRIVPIIFVIAVGLYLLHRQSIGFRKEAILGLLLMGLISLLVFLPLLNYSLANPDNFSYRTLTRVGTIERDYPGSPLPIFLDNLWDAMTMFAWDNGEVWIMSVTHRPALDIVSGALFYLGLCLLVIRYIRRRHWLDLFVILSLPLLMMPSILSIAFPAENPSLNRTAAALVPVFLLIGLSLDGFLSGIESHIAPPVGRGLVWVIGILLLVWSGFQNYDLVFNQYQREYALSSWNSSEIGQAINDFTVAIDSHENAYVVAFPHWVDTRLVGINAGFPTKDFAIWPEDFSKTAQDQGAKLFIVKIDDADSMTALQNLYPDGIIQRHTSEVLNKDFYQFYVLPE
jgi:hypothetical protein